MNPEILNLLKNIEDMENNLKVNQAKLKMLREICTHHYGSWLKDGDEWHPEQFRTCELCGHVEITYGWDLTG